MSKKSKTPRQRHQLAPPTTDKPATSVELAGIGVRFAALIYDGLLIFAINAIVAVILVVIATPSDISSQNQTQVLSSNFRHLVLFPAMVLMTWLFYGYFWRRRGQTLGMQTWRLKVIKPNGQLLSWSDSMGRCAASLILPSICGLAANFLHHSKGVFALSLVFGFMANYLWAWANGRRLTWHDQLSATVVIRVPEDPRQKRGVLGWFSKTDEEYLFDSAQSASGVEANQSLSSNTNLPTIHQRITPVTAKSSLSNSWANSSLSAFIFI